MILAIHVGVALASIAWATFAFFRPSDLKIKGSYMLVFSTLASGTYLVVAMNASLLRTCLSGILYVAVVLALTLQARQKLAAV